KHRNATSRDARPKAAPQPAAQQSSKRARSPEVAGGAPAKKRVKKGGIDSEKSKSKDREGESVGRPGLAAGKGVQAKGAQAKGRGRDEKSAKALTENEGGKKGKKGRGEKKAKDSARPGRGGDDYIPPSTPTRPIQLYHFDDDDFTMPTPPPKAGNGKVPALASLNERDTPPPSPNKQSKRGKGKNTARPKPKHRPPPQAKEDAKALDSAHDSDADESDNNNDSNRLPLRKGKGRATLPLSPHPHPPQEDSDGSDSGDDLSLPPPRRKDKGKQRAERPDVRDLFADDTLPPSAPGIFQTGDFLDDDAPLPDLSGLIDEGEHAHHKGGEIIEVPERVE
ncbi:hypothetical protein HDZ31DRAFT_70753, partial [Schizophyllum fasciatum]